MKTRVFTYATLTALLLVAAFAKLQSTTQADVMPPAIDIDAHRVTVEPIAPEAGEPPHREFIALKTAVERYRRIAQNGGWRTPPRGLNVSKGDDNGQVLWLRRFFETTGDLDRPAGQLPRTEFDEDLEQAIAHFESRHALKADGKLDEQLIAAMKVPVQSRLAQLQLNLQRARALPPDLGSQYVRVNIPDYRLDVIEKDRSVLDMRVIVGKPNNPTPAFSGNMSSVVMSPYWNIPPEILREETLPLAEQDPSYLERNNIEVIYRSGGATPIYRQRPGPRNSLGLVKFMFPNPYNVYMHDTPADSLFKPARRAFSHGCIRLEKPEELARYVLSAVPGWSVERIRAAMHSGQERHVTLPAPIAVHILYLTAWVDPAGNVHFREDIYHRDHLETSQPGRLTQQAAG